MAITCRLLQSQASDSLQALAIGMHEACKGAATPRHFVAKRTKGTHPY